MDQDLRLLGGDALYALGLRRLAEIGDLEAVAELSDLISAAARAQAEGSPERAERLWLDSARRLGPGALRRAADWRRGVATRRLRARNLGGRIFFSRRT